MKKRLSVLLAAALTACLLSGCGGGEDTQVCNVACVVAIANNNPLVVPEDLKELTALAALPGSTYAIINAEGSPRVICSGTIPDLSARGYTEAMMARVETSIQADIQGKIAAAAPLSPEVDVAAATALAVRTLRASAGQDRSNLLVCHLSGISTSGLVDMTAVPVWELDVEASAADLAARMDVDMTGIDVLMYCCGDVAGEDQPPLSDRERGKLKDFYRLLFTGLGAASVRFLEDIPASGSYHFDQPVAVMETEGTASGLRAAVVPCEEAGEDALAEALEGGGIVDFDEAAIRFRPDSTDLADPAAAREALAYVIDYMQAHPDFRLLVCGTTATAGTLASSIAFSEKRAGTVRALLLEAGIAPDRVQALGCGYGSLLHVPDLREDGTLDERAAPQNRSVKLVDCGSETAGAILASLP